MTETLTAPPADVTAPAVGLDRVMLAMDVVDTLRHQRALVESELDDDRRQRDFVARVQAIYESQGIEVPESVIEEGVRALREDRFVYAPPKRSWSVRFAEIYVERRKWTFWSAIVLAVGLLIWAAFALPGYYRERGLIDGFRQRTIRIEASVEELSTRGKRIEEKLERSRAANNSSAGVRLLTEAENALLEGMGHTESVHTALASIPAPEAYLTDRARWDPAVAAYAETAGWGDAALDRAAGLLSVVQQLRELRVQLDAAKARLLGIELAAAERTKLDAAASRTESALAAGDAHAGAAAMHAFDTEIEAAVTAHLEHADIRAQFTALKTAFTSAEGETAAELRSLKSEIEQAIAAGDWQRASRLVVKLRTLVQVLEQAYELRIVSRGNAQSGVWRIPPDNRKGRNYYIIVEAIGADGKALTLPIENEEDQSTSLVREFGIRVPERVFEQVKADKLDNGLIDNVVFGTKRRGVREPEYRFPVAGGRITRW